jgi:hypothetical protein
MCRNHSHLIAQFTGEDTTGEYPVLTFELDKTTVTLESPGKGGAVLILPTSGRLLVPSIALGDCSAAPRLPMEGPSMSLCFLPGDAMTITRLAVARWNMSSVPSEITW